VRRYPNRGHAPHDHSIPLGIEFAGGHIARHPYTADKLRWSITGSEFDIAFYWRLDGKDEEQGQERDVA